MTSIVINIKKNTTMQKGTVKLYLLALLTALLQTGTTLAANGEYDTPSTAISWYSKGPGCIHLTILAQEYNADRNLSAATFYLVDSEGNKTACMYFHEADSHDKKELYVTSIMQNKLAETSHLFLTNDTKYTPYCYIDGEERQHDHTRITKSSNTYAEFDWYYPVSFAGKKMTWRVEGQLYNRGSKKSEDYTKDICTIDFDDINLECYDAVPGTEAGDEASMRIPISCDRPINYIDAYYIDRDGKRKTLPRLTLENDSYFTFLPVPATDKITDLTIIANIQSANIDPSNLPEKSYPSVLDGDLTKVIDKMPIIHQPRFLRSDVDSVGAVVLRWKVLDRDVEDLIDGDIFSIQRSLTGREEDFEDLQSDAIYDPNVEDYSFRDSTLISALTAAHIDQQLGIPLVRYRVFRGMTNEMWGLVKDPTVVYTQPQFATLALLQPKDVRAVWSNETEHKAKLTWNWTENDASHNYVWDDERTQLKVETKMFNRQGALVDSVVTILTKDQYRAREAELTLTRSCVTYEMRLIVDGSKSPIGKGEAGIFKLVRSKEDFEQYAKNIYDDPENAVPNAILAADISLGSTEGYHWLGYTDEKPFSGNLNGNGHTITINSFPGTWQQYAALVRHAGNGAVITGLTTAGEFAPHEKFASGLVGTILTGEVHIENCVSNVTLDAHTFGDIQIPISMWADGSFGTFVGIVQNGSNASLRITNSYANQRIKYPYVRNCSGFVGWCQANGFAKISNSYLNDISTTDEGSENFIRSYKLAPQWTIIEDCTYKNGMSSSTQGKQSGTPPNNWCWKNGRPDVRQVEFSTPVSGSSTTTVALPQGDFYFENLGHINKESLQTQTQQSSVVLTWENVDDAPVDYYEVRRRDVLTPGKEELLVTQLIDMYYEDNSVSPTHSYEYSVRGVNSCEGLKFEDTPWVPGCCVQTGLVSGYVSFPDGTGIPRVTVLIDSPQQSFQVETDESGYFVKDGLPYWNNGGESSYDIMPQVDGFSGQRSVSFDAKPGGNSVSNVVFYIENSVKFSGVVRYFGTSIPVQGASFLLDDLEVRNAGGKVTTDFEGRFSFRMLPGKPHSIQAVKDGHTFYQDGFYHADDDLTKTKYEFNTDVANTYFYDDTRVTLIGRVAGGKDQGDIPLGNSLSKNNLGDELKMVFVLEGDNASQLVFDVTDRNKKERDEVFTHKAHDSKYTYQTSVHTTSHRMEVTPDIHTGEYLVKLPPVKWKIQQITARGYSTLFQDGQTGDVIDLSDSLTTHTDHFTGEWTAADKSTVNEVDVTYHAQYSRIYRSPVLLERMQVGYDKFDYFGEKFYTMQTVSGPNKQIPIAYPDTVRDPRTGKETIVTHYTFGYPVFNIDRSYKIKLSALERYYYNNNTKSDTVDVVRLGGGKVTIRNGLVSGTQRDTLSLDENGEGTYTLRAAQMPYLATGKDALYTVNFTMERDGVSQEGEPLKAYVFSQYAKPGAKDILTFDRPLLVDILRDPPGSGSSAKLSKGSTIKLAYQMDMAWKTGLSLGIKAGGGMNWYTGLVTSSAPGGVGPEYGLINSTTSLYDTSIDLLFSGSGQRAFAYTMTANEDISTDASVTMVGADADVYMGVETNIFLRPTVAVRAINDSTYKASEGARKAGYMVEIANGRDENDSIFYLVRDEVIGLGQTVKSTFAHSQQYIVKQLIPNLAQQCQSLMFFGTEAEAKARANATKEPVYRSLRDKDDEDFGLLNSMEVINEGDSEWEYVYNTTINTAQPGINYQIVLPDGYDGAEDDKVQDFCEAMLTWMNMIARNEKEKLYANKLMKNFDLDGGSPMTYSEDFAAEHSATASYNYLATDWTHNYFSNSDPYGDGYGDLERTHAAFSSMAMLLGGTAAKLLFSKINNSKAMKRGNVTPQEQENGNPSPLAEKDFEMNGKTYQFSLNPTLAYGVTPKNSNSFKYNRKETFNIKMDKKSHLDFDVYYASVIDSRDANDKIDKMDVFVEDNFLYTVDYVDFFIGRDVGARDVIHDMQEPRGFLYRTRGGATARTWEDERRTLFFHAGTVLDERTKKIENPVIKMDKQSISGVPHDQPARFKLYMTNESEQPEAINGALQFFTLFHDDTSNPKGARLLIDGMPLTRDGMTIKAVPGEVTEKTLEVWAGEDFDYEDLKIGLVSQGDLKYIQEVEFSVHYLLEAGSVQIAMPGDKWIMNTDALYDPVRGWYQLVIINGFDKNQRNFDHIEFQYKESTRGDDYWTNLCGFYADSTIYRAASGTKEMIPENGYIQTKFFGDGQVMEKAYDLRARLFCRNGNSFVTSDSKVLSGVKDTRRPQLFGTMEPKDGILGTGDNIIFNFSEDIEHNYLQTDNFEVLGETNETAVQEEPALLFGGKGYAQSEARRNFMDKNMTVEVLIKPDKHDSDMPVFSHGTDGKQLQLWLTKDKRLRAVVNDNVLESNDTINTDGYRQVALVVDNDNKRVSIICEDFMCSLDSVTYNGYGPIIFGSTNQTDVNKREFYKGRMLQGRVWNRVMTRQTLTTYGKKLLTGYEMGLTDYYPMNEGSGDYATDLAQGAHLKLNGVTWALPRGMALKLDRSEANREVKGMEVRSERFSRTEEEDYTLMFWFKTDLNGRGALISNGSGDSTDTDARHKFFIGFEGKDLKYRTNGHEYLLGDTYSDDQWHHYAMTVNRSHQVASIYVDMGLKAQFSTESLGGMKGKDFYLGNMVWYEAGPNDNVRHQNYALTGWLDGICLFEQALPPTLLRRYMEKSVGGGEKGLVTFLGFNRQERRLNNDYTLQPYGLNQKIYYDDGKELERRDTVFVDALDYVIDHIDRNYGAPMQAYQELRNLNFSFVGRDNQLLVNIDENDARVNKRQVFVTVYDIPDLNGNYMASPATTEVFVDRNPLRWESKSYKTTVKARPDTDSTFQLNVINNSGAPHTFTIENMPRWLTVNKQQDVIEAKNEETLTFTISKDINAGTYDNVIYLTDENVLSEPLMLNVTVEGDKPQWEVNDGMKQFSMSIVGKVQIEDDIVTDSRDIVCVFDSIGRCMGIGNISYDSFTAESFVFITVYDSMTVERPINFQLWHYETGKTMVLVPSQKVKFSPDSFVGTTKNPLVLSARTQFVQTIELMPGWNWISPNVITDGFYDIENQVNRFMWQEGDMLTDEKDNISFIYLNGEWISNIGTAKITDINLNVKKSYRVKVSDPRTVEIIGNAIKAQGDRTITVENGWNFIGYTPMVNLPVSTALADYLDHAEDGDIIKSKTEFSMFTKTDNGSRQWKGNLKYMKPGEGYMLYHQHHDTVQFVYSYFEPNATFFEDTGRQNAPRATKHARTMSLTAEAEGIDIQEGDKLMAFANGELVGTTEAEIEDSRSPLFYLSINGDQQLPVFFAIERDGEVIATTASVLEYRPDAVSGSPSQPAKIQFLQVDAADGKWYDLNGRMVKNSNSATHTLRKGIYINNGKKKMVK